MEKMSKPFRSSCDTPTARVRSMFYTHAVKPFPPRSDGFSLNLRHIRIVGTIFFSKCGGFNVIVLATRLHLYRAVVVLAATVAGDKQRGTLSKLLLPECNSSAHCRGTFIGTSEEEKS